MTQLATAPTARNERPAPSRPPRSRQHSAYLFIAPVGLGLGILYLYPAVSTFALGFTEWGPFGGHTFTGFTNYLTVFQLETFWTALGNTLLYMLIGLLTLPVAIVFAVLLNRRACAV